MKPRSSQKKKKRQVNKNILSKQNVDPHFNAEQQTIRRECLWIYDAIMQLEQTIEREKRSLKELQKKCKHEITYRGWNSHYKVCEICGENIGIKPK